MAESDSFYIKIRDKVTGVIQKYGTSYQVRTAGGEYDPSTMTTGSPGAPRSVVGIVADQEFVYNLGSQIYPVSGASAASIGKKNLILTSTANPVLNEEVLVDGKWYSLVKAKPIKPADIVVIYILDLTK